MRQHFCQMPIYRQEELYIMPSDNLATKEVQTFCYQKKLTFSQNHIDARFKFISTYITEPLELKDPLQRPSLPVEQQKLYRQNLALCSEYNQFKDQTLNLFKVFNYSAQSVFKGSRDIIQLLNRLLRMSQTDIRINYINQAHGKAIWEKAAKIANPHSVSLNDLIQTIYLEIDLQLFRMLSIIRQDIFLNTYHQQAKFLKESLHNAHQNLHILTTTFYEKGTKQNMEYLTYIQHHLLCNQVQFPQISNQILVLQKKVVQSKLQHYRTQYWLTLQKQDVVSAMCMPSQTQIIQNPEIKSFKEKKLKDILSQRGFKRVFRCFQTNIVDPFIEEIFAYKWELRQNIQQKLRLHSQDGQQIQRQTALLIIELMVKFFILVQSFGISSFHLVHLFTIGNQAKEVCFLQKFILNCYLRPIPFIEKVEYIGKNVKEFCEIWFKSMSLYGASECLICCSILENSKFYSIFNCVHRFCIQCLRSYFAQKINSFQLPVCPSGQCPNSFISQKSKFFKYIPKQIISQFLQVQRFHIVSKDPQLKLCPQEKCEGIIKMERLMDEGIDRRKASCPVCLSEYCWQCMMKFHKNKCETNELDFLLNDLHYRQCSNCKAVVQRIEGCPHMTCLCKNEFCYYCGQKWTSRHQGQCQQIFEQQWPRIINQNEIFREFREETIILQRIQYDPFENKASYCLPLMVIEKTKAILLTLKENIRNYVLVLQILIWTLVVIVMITFFPVFFVLVYLLEGILIIIGYAIFSASRWDQNPYMVAIIFIIFPISATIGFIAALNYESAYKNFRTSFNRLIPIC